MSPNPNCVHINSFILWNTCEAYADIRDVDPRSHTLWVEISIGSNMSLMVKSDFHHIWMCVKPLDGCKASMPKPIFPHQVHILEMWLCWVMDLNGFGQWSSPHVLNCWKNNPIIGVPNLWKSMEHSHKFTNCNNLNQQNY